MDEAEIEPGSADLVVAMGSMQYAADPGAVLRLLRRLGEGPAAMSASIPTR